MIRFEETVAVVPTADMTVAVCGVSRSYRIETREEADKKRRGPYEVPTPPDIAPTGELAGLPARDFLNLVSPRTRENDFILPKNAALARETL